MVKLNEPERRYLPGNIEIRESDNGRPIITGYAAVFNKRSENFHWDPEREFYEEIAPGAFDSVIGDDVRAMFNHDGLPLARTKSGTLKIEQDAIGLRYEFEAPDTTLGNDLASAIRRGDVDASSFAFRVADDGDRLETEGSTTIRTITKLSRLVDVSPVTYPAYPDTSVVARSAEQLIKEQEERERKERGDADQSEKETISMNAEALRSEHEQYDLENSHHQTHTTTNHD